MSLPTHALRPGLSPEALASAARSAAGAGTLGFRIGAAGRGVTYGVEGASIVASEGPDGADTIVGLDDDAWADLTSQRRTFINLFLADAAHVRGGGFEQLADWDPSSSATPCRHPRSTTPARVHLGGRRPDAVRSRSTTPMTSSPRSCPPWATSTCAGCSRPPRWPRQRRGRPARRRARTGDDQSWWVTDEQTTTVLCRLIYAAAALRGAGRHRARPSARAVGPSAPDHSRGSPPTAWRARRCCSRRPGDTKGLSNIPWHQDCGMGGHASSARRSPSASSSRARPRPPATSVDAGQPRADAALPVGEAAPPTCRS